MVATCAVMQGASLAFALAFSTRFYGGMVMKTLMVPLGLAKSSAALALLLTIRSGLGLVRVRARVRARARVRVSPNLTLTLTRTCAPPHHQRVRPRHLVLAVQGLQACRREHGRLA